MTKNPVKGLLPTIMLTIMAKNKVDITTISVNLSTTVMSSTSRDIMDTNTLLPMTKMMRDHTIAISPSLANQK